MVGMEQENGRRYDQQRQRGRDERERGEEGQCCKLTCADYLVDRDPR